jgi:hypothetical protein
VVPTPSFLDWLKEEVEPKLRIAAAHFENASVPSYLIGQAVATGVQPFLYWSRDRASSSSLPPGPAPVSLSKEEQVIHGHQAAMDELRTQGVRFDGPYAKTDQWQPPALWTVLNGKLKILGYQWSKEARAWVKA